MEVAALDIVRLGTLWFCGFGDQVIKSSRGVQHKSVSFVLDLTLMVMKIFVDLGFGFDLRGFGDKQFCDLILVVVLPLFLFIDSGADSLEGV